MKVYYARHQESDESYFSTSASDLAAFIGCNANYLREQLNIGRKSFKGYLIDSGELSRIVGRGGFMRDNTQY